MSGREVLDRGTGPERPFVKVPVETREVTEWKIKSSPWPLTPDCHVRC